MGTNRDETLDPGKNALREERGALGSQEVGKSLRDLAAAASKYSAAHPRRGNSPLFPNSSTLYPPNAFYAPVDTSFQITTDRIPSAFVSGHYTYQMLSENAYGDVTWSIASGGLGSGFSMSSGGLISGTGLYATSGTDVLIHAIDQLSHTDDKAFTFYVLEL